jgi:hypothetical protein
VDKFFIAQADKIRLKINNLKENQWFTLKPILKH